MISQLLQVPKFEVKIPKFIFGKDLGNFWDVLGKTYGGAKCVRKTTKVGAKRFLS